ncbi:hypothetical protein GC169_10395 [bacterium]|nr:hypothetical protein [bacterium]
MDIERLFPTHIARASLLTDRRDRAWNDDIVAAAISLSKEDEAGRRWCRDRGYDGYTSYASLDDLPARATCFAELENRVLKHAGALADALAFDLGRGRLRCDSMWVNVLGPGGAHSGHIHPHSVISGTYYASTPDGSGTIRFEDPRLSMMMAAPPVRAAPPRERERFVHVAPEVGDLLLWESWLRHEVQPNRAASARISVSFNLAWG